MVNSAPPELHQHLDETVARYGLGATARALDHVHLFRALRLRSRQALDAARQLFDAGTESELVFRLRPAMSTARDRVEIQVRTDPLTGTTDEPS